ncbi:hypothetical protein JG687_00003071, partial [Phytophthora cactorum]
MAQRRSTSTSTEKSEWRVNGLGMATGSPIRRMRRAVGNGKESVEQSVDLDNRNLTNDAGNEAPVTLEALQAAVEAETLLKDSPKVKVFLQKARNEKSGGDERISRARTTRRDEGYETCGTEGWKTRTAIALVKVVRQERHVAESVEVVSKDATAATDETSTVPLRVWRTRRRYDRLVRKTRAREKRRALEWLSAHNYPETTYVRFEVMWRKATKDG